MARQRSRTAQEYEQELRRRELLLARSLSQLVSEGDPEKTKPNAVARALTQAIRDLRALRRDLDAELHPPPEPPAPPEPQPRDRGGRGPGLGRRGPTPGEARRPAKSQTPKPAPRRRLSAKDVLAYEAAGNEIDEVLERWERRLERLSPQAYRRLGPPPVPRTAQRGRRGRRPSGGEAGGGRRSQGGQG